MTLQPVYFDSSVFLAIFMGEKTGPEIRALVRELEKDKVRILTSILTIEEVSVLTYRRGTRATDNFSKVHKLARIEGVTKDIALTAAKLEAQLKDIQQDNAPKSQRDQEEENRRRKWDCFHIASAMELGCATLYTLDRGMLKRKEQLRIKDVEFDEPRPRNPQLTLEAGTEVKKSEATAKKSDGTTAAGSVSVPPVV